MDGVVLSRSTVPPSTLSCPTAGAGAGAGHDLVTVRCLRAFIMYPSTLQSVTFVTKRRMVQTYSTRLLLSHYIRQGL